LLLAGHVPSLEMKTELERRVAHLPSYRHIYNEVTLSHRPSQSVEDALITMRIRTKVLADSMIDPQPFKVATTDGVVYLMGEVRASEARRILQIASETHGVLKVVKLFKYYTLT
jgi:osmotically-inducible protein OsmY